MSPTFADLSQEWLRVYSAPRHSAEWHEKSTYYLHSCILPKFGPLSVDDVKQQEVARMVNAIAEAGLRVKANHVLVTTRGVFAWGITTGRIGCPNPARDIKRQRWGRARGCSLARSWRPSGTRAPDWASGASSAVCSSSRDAAAPRSAPWCGRR